MCKKIKLAKFMFGLSVRTMRWLFSLQMFRHAWKIKRTMLLKDNVGYVAIFEADGSTLVVAPLADSIVTQTFDDDLHMTEFTRHEHVVSVRDEMREWILARYS